MFEMLASVLAAAPIQALALGPQKQRTFAQNSAILAVDIANFRPLADFTRDADTLAELLKALPRQEGFDEILLPGERADRTEIVRRKSRMPIAEKFGKSLRRSQKPQASRCRICAASLLQLFWVQLARTTGASMAENFPSLAPKNDLCRRSRSPGTVRWAGRMPRRQRCRRFTSKSY